MTQLPDIDTHRVTATETRTCDKHGEFESRRWELVRMPTPRDGQPLPPFLSPFWSKCPTCDAEIARENDAHDSEIRGGRSRAQELFAARLRESGVPARFLECDFWRWQHALPGQRTVWNAVRDYLSNLDIALQTGRSFAFMGQPGTGKTSLAVGMLRHVMQKGGTGCYTTAFEMVGRIRASYQRDADESERDVIRSLSACDLLVIDEIGRQLDSTHEREQMWRVLDARYAGLKPVVLCTNLTADQFRALIGSAMVDRLREGGGAFLQFDWGSMRDRKQRKDADDA